MGLLHRGLQFALGYVLDLLVNREYDILTRLRLLFDAAKPFSPGIDGDQHFSRLAMQFVVEFALNATQALIVGAHVTDDLGGQLTLGIKPLGFFLEVDAAKIERPDAVCGLGIRFAS
jgi:hypothetical protein